MPLVANLVSLTATAWGIVSALGGWMSDVIGRRPILIAAPFALALTLVAQAAAGSFFWVGVWAAVGGGCAGAFTGVVFAEVSSRVHDSQRGRALGWVMSGQSLTLVVGVPMAAAIGSVVGWRGWLLCVAGLSIAAVLSLFLTVGRGSAGHTRGSGARPSMRAALSPRVLKLLSTGVAERICYGLAVVYFATFMQVTYDMTLLELALPLAVFALGNIAGTVLGGQLADRLRDRLLTFAVAMALSGVAALLLFIWHPGPTVSVAVGFVYVLLECTRAAFLHGGPRLGTGGCARHRAGSERHLGQRRLDRRRRPGRRDDRLGGLRRLRAAHRPAGPDQCPGCPAQPPQPLLVGLLLLVVLHIHTARLSFTSCSTAPTTTRSPRKSAAPG